MPDPLAPEITQCLVEQLEQAVVKVRHCVGQLNDQQIWTRPFAAGNSIGNLIVHVEGNLRQWGVVPLLQCEDNRDRAAEFAQSAIIPVTELMARLDAIVEQCRVHWLHGDSETLLQRTQVQGFDVSICEALLHTAAHFVGHTHQIILQTRLILGSDYQFHWSPDLPRDQVPL